MRGKRHSPVLKHTLKLASEKSTPCRPTTGRRQFEPNWFWETASGSGCCVLLPSVEMDAAIPPFASFRPCCYQHCGARGWLRCSRETSCKDIFLSRYRWFLCTSRGTLRGLLPTVWGAVLSPQNLFLSLSQQSSHSPVIPCDIARSWHLCQARLTLCRAVLRSGLQPYCMPTGSKHLTIRW